MLNGNHCWVTGLLATCLKFDSHKPSQTFKISITKLVTSKYTIFPRKKWKENTTIYDIPDDFVRQQSS